MKTASYSYQKIKLASALLVTPKCIDLMDKLVGIFEWLPKHKLLVLLSSKISLFKYLFVASIYTRYFATIVDD